MPSRNATLARALSRMKRRQQDTGELQEGWRARWERNTDARKRWTCRDRAIQRGRRTSRFDVTQATSEALQRQDERDARLRRQMAEDLASAYEKGADHAARRVAEAHGDSNFRRFSAYQKAT